MTGGIGRIGAGVGGIGLLVGVGAAACLGDALGTPISSSRLVWRSLLGDHDLTLLTMQTSTTLTALAAGLALTRWMATRTAREAGFLAMNRLAKVQRTAGIDGDGGRNGVLENSQITVLY